jgi:tetratricopeptide (TPR) repeat protein
LLVEWDWQGAEAAMRRAVAINPRLAVGHAYLGLLLAARGRRDEAIAAAQCACDLEPFSVLMNQIRCWVLFHSGQYEAALTQARHRASGLARLVQSLALAQLGRLDEAVALLERS